MNPPIRPRLSTNYYCRMCMKTVLHKREAENKPWICVVCGLAKNKVNRVRIVK